MTKEEAWRKVKGYLYDALDGETADELIKVLEEPCDNCVSRQAVLEGKVIHQSCDGVEIIKSYAVPVEYIEQLPPVTPQLKTGHWLPYAEENGKTVKWVCSSCRRVKSITNDKTEYCPVCGAEMQEV